VRSGATAWVWALLARIFSNAVSMVGTRESQQRSFLLAQFFLKKSIFEKTEPAGFSRLFG